MEIIPPPTRTIITGPAISPLVLLSGEAYPPLPECSPIKITAFQGNLLLGSVIVEKTHSPHPDKEVALTLPSGEDFNLQISRGRVTFLVPVLDRTREFQTISEAFIAGLPFFPEGNRFFRDVEFHWGFPFRLSGLGDFFQLGRNNLHRDETIPPGLEKIYRPDDEDSTMPVAANAGLGSDCEDLLVTALQNLDPESGYLACFGEANGSPHAWLGKRNKDNSIKAVELTGPQASSVYYRYYFIKETQPHRIRIQSIPLGASAPLFQPSIEIPNAIPAELEQFLCPLDKLQRGSDFNTVAKGIIRDKLARSSSLDKIQSRP